MTQDQIREQRCYLYGRRQDAMKAVRDLDRLIAQNQRGCKHPNVSRHEGWDPGTGDRTITSCDDCGWSNE